MEYLDFEVAIDPTIGSDYRVTVLDSPAGQTSEATHFPFGQEQLKSCLGALRETLARSRGNARDVAPNGVDADSGQKAAEEFGGALFEFLFPGDVRNLFIQSLRQAEEKPDRGLRVRFRTQAPELAVLPWELLYDRRPGNFVCLSNATPFVRFLPTQQPAGILTVTPPLRILGMISSPPALAALDTSGEMARVEAALAESTRRGRIELTWLQGGSWQALKEALGSGKGPWHVFHFIGHGGFDEGRDGYLVLTTEQGERYDLSAMSLSNLLADHRSLRLVVLNACKGAQGSGGDLFSSTASTLVRRGLPAVVSMQQEISDNAALEFSREFYRTLASGYPVDGAVAEARKCISLALPRSVEWATPMLHMRSPDGVLFNLQALDRLKPELDSVKAVAVEPRVVGQGSAKTSVPSRSRSRWLRAALGVGLVAGLGIVWYLNQPNGHSTPPHPSPTPRDTTRVVPSPPHIIAFDRATATLVPGTALALHISGSPPGTTPSHSLMWSSSAPRIAAVDSKGAVHAVSHGTAVITARDTNGSSAKVRITVLAPVARVEVDTSSPPHSRGTWFHLRPGSTLLLKATTFDSAGSVLNERRVTWHSTDTLKATVSPEGLVSARARGFVSIRATSEGTTGFRVVNVGAEE